MNNLSTVKLDDKERLDKEQSGVKETSPIGNLLHKDKEHLALGNNFWVSKNSCGNYMAFPTDLRFII